MPIVAIKPAEFDAALHQLPRAGELLLPGDYACLSLDGIVFAVNEALLSGGACGTVVELCRPGDGVEVALNAQRQDDGGFFFDALWVLAG